jgi:hypothetical protein
MPMRTFLPLLMLLFALPSCQKAGGCPDPQLKRKNRNAICQQILAPVCGCDGRTHGNECEARGKGIHVAHTGECAPAVPE